MVDGYILISAHLSSKEDRNKAQKDKMIAYLERLKNLYPAYGIILGADVNSFLELKD